MLLGACREALEQQLAALMAAAQRVGDGSDFDDDEYSEDDEGEDEGVGAVATPAGGKQVKSEGNADEDEYSDDNYDDDFDGSEGDSGSEGGNGGGGSPAHSPHGNDADDGPDHPHSNDGNGPGPFMVKRSTLQLPTSIALPSSSSPVSAAISGAGGVARTLSAARLLDAKVGAALGGGPPVRSAASAEQRTSDTSLVGVTAGRPGSVAGPVGDAAGE